MIELLKVEDHGATVNLTFKVNKRLSAYLVGILDHLFGVARHLHFKSQCAAAERRAFQKVYQVDGDKTKVKMIRNEMILYLKEELEWSADQIGEAYDLTPENIRQILSREKRLKQRPNLRPERPSRNGIDDQEEITRNKRRKFDPQNRQNNKNE